MKISDKSVFVSMRLNIDDEHTYELMKMNAEDRIVSLLKDKFPAYSELIELSSKENYFHRFILNILKMTSEKLYDCAEQLLKN